MSVSAALAYRSDGQRCRLLFQVKPGSYDTASLITFLTALRRHFCGQKVILVWDGLPAHRSRAMTASLRTQRAGLRVERLPSYAPELNPVESVWGNVKGRALANRCADALGEAAAAFQTGMGRVRRSQQLCFAFLDHAGLSF